MKWFGILYVVCCSVVCASTAEEQIVIKSDFIERAQAQQLIDCYNKQNRALNDTSCNGLAIPSIYDPKILALVRGISQRVRELVAESYPWYLGTLHLDHAELTARIEGNWCPYHADNIRFECPQHGSDQGALRLRCPGTCPGARFMPNHTAWREFTALLYLNDDFEGGEIVFEDGPCAHTYRKTIPIRACELVLSPDGPSFYHEVLPMRRGTRYSLNLWYTSNPQYACSERHISSR